MAAPLLVWAVGGWRPRRVRSTQLPKRCSRGCSASSSTSVCRHAPSPPPRSPSLQQRISARSRLFVARSRPSVTQQSGRRLTHAISCDWQGCKTHKIAHHLLRTAPHLHVVCWQTLAEDNAARAFSVGFYSSIASQLEREARQRKRWRDQWPLRRCVARSIHRRARLAVRSARCALLSPLWLAPPTPHKRIAHEPRVLPPTPHSSPYAPTTIQPSTEHRRPSRRISIEAAFAAGCEKFRQKGFKFGDPEEHLHPPGHPHHHRPDFLNCPHCTPPVHGQVRASL